jgi:tRNA nucleotidyltransferase/poly(A) polymerase
MSDYMFLLESRLSPDQLQSLVQVHQAAAGAHMPVFLVGGTVRDLLGGFPIRDLDFSVEGPALKLVRHLDRGLFTIRSTDEQRQAVELVFGGGATLEIGMSRRETYPKAGGKPEIEPATIQDDLRRRDFSVNAIALSLNQASRGLLLDPTNGLADMERKELRTLSNYGFYDDPSRMLRLIRLQSRLKYSIEERTRNQFGNAREAGALDQIPPRSRLRELQQVADEPEMVEAVKGLESAGLLEVFEPHLGKKLDLPMLARLEKTRRLVEKSGLRIDSFGPFLWALTKKLSTAERIVLRTRLGLKADEAKAWTELETRARTLQKTLAGKQMAQNSRLYEAVTAEDPAVALFLIAYSQVKEVRDRLRSYFRELRPAVSKVRDEEIEELGAKRGTAKFEKLREAYLAARLDKKISNKDEAVKVLESYL